MLQSGSGGLPHGRPYRRCLAVATSALGVLASALAVPGRLRTSAQPSGAHRSRRNWHGSEFRDGQRLGLGCGNEQAGEPHRSTQVTTAGATHRTRRWFPERRCWAFKKGTVGGTGGLAPEGRPFRPLSLNGSSSATDSGRYRLLGGTCRCSDDTPALALVILTRLRHRRRRWPVRLAGPLPLPSGGRREHVRVSVLRSSCPWPRESPQLWP